MRTPLNLIGWDERARWQRALLLFLLGALTTLTLAPFCIAPLLWITIPLLITIIRQADRKKTAFWSGWWFGFGYFSTGLYWFAHALLIDAATHGWLIPFAVFGIGGILACYSGLTSWLSHYGRTLPIISFSLLFALLWCAVGIIRSYAFSGFPWNLIGYAAAFSETTIQLGAIGGIWWVSLIVMTIASMPLWCVQDGKIRIIPILLIFAGMVISILTSSAILRSHPTEYHPDITLRLVQAAIPQTLKIDSNHRYQILEEHMMLSLEDGYEDITHIIWPESAMPFRFDENSQYASMLAKIVPKGGALLTGVVRVERDGERISLYNSLQSLTNDGEIDAVYRKRKLVPFGEFIPFREWLPLTKITPGARDFDVGPDEQPTETLGAPEFQPLICYEAIFPHLSDGAYPGWLLNITNDGWFGISTGPYQHFHMARMRAVEQGVPLIRAANSGVSAIIDPYGRVVTTLGLGEKGVIDHGLPVARHAPTLYGRYGAWIVILTSLCYASIIFWSARQRSS